MAKKIKTNEQLLKALYNDLSSIEAAILRERIIKIGAMTQEVIRSKPETFNNPFVHISVYESVCAKIKKHLDVE